MEQKNGWFAFWQKLMKCLSKQDETGVGDTKSVAPVNTIIQSIKGVSSSKEKDSSKVKSLTESVDTFLKSRYDFRYNVLTEETEYWKNCRYGMEWIAWRLWHAEFRETNCG